MSSHAPSIASFFEEAPPMENSLKMYVLTYAYYWLNCSKTFIIAYKLVLVMHAAFRWMVWTGMVLFFFSNQTGMKCFPLCVIHMLKEIGWDQPSNELGPGCFDICIDEMTG